MNSKSLPKIRSHNFAYPVVVKLISTFVVYFSPPFNHLRVAEQTASISIIEWGRVTMAGVLEELDSKLSSTFQIKNKPMTNGDEVDKLEVLLLFAVIFCTLNGTKM